MRTAGRVVIIGDARIEEIRDDLGAREFVGGAALNVAVGLARLGFPTSLIAMVGDDSDGDHIRSYLDDYGVRLIATTGRHGTVRVASVRSPGHEPTREFNRAAKHRGIQFGAVEAHAVATAAQTIVSCFPFDDAAQTRALAKALEGAEGHVCIDPNPKGGVLRDRAEFISGFESVIANASLVKLDDDDAAVLYGASIAELRARLVRMGVDAVMTTSGTAGAIVGAGGTVVSAPISKMPGLIIDTVGAGDAALSSVIASLLSHSPQDASQWQEVLVTAMDVAAATCRFEGPLLRLPSALSGLGVGRFGS
ncbi:fructokinase [Microbacterium endophyticum]|uniref:Fructokinase n=1 Tax=Microbacterium endophyticum TaxID=1526412 RepID=A0A7W4YNJ9_9MICO|nr:PfkB family carbohydrate kinase [Microbacterium endophyticum]MBB2976659.1 fructokinase [Microbacterium endophyticum]NIK37620.1 fructokinase [Microbacterium endophyticum]